MTKKRGLKENYQYFIVFLRYNEKYEGKTSAILYHRFYDFAKTLPNLEFMYKIFHPEHNIMLVFYQTLKEFKKTHNEIQKKLNVENIKIYISEERWRYEN